MTAEVKEATRRRILDAARELFRVEWFASTTTRDIARRAEIANGTLFNYFPTKEAVAAALAGEALAAARRRYGRRKPPPASLEESLFALIAEELRALRPHRGYLRPVLETALRPAAGEPEDPIRSGHLEIVRRLMEAHGHPDTPSFVTLHLYWTLYTGALAFWADDASPHQEDTLAVLDRSLNAFVASLAAEEGET